MPVPVLAKGLKALRLPLVVGVILAGIAIGHSGLNLMQKTPTIDFLAEVGFGFLMFLSGLEVSFSSLSHSQRARWGGAGALHEAKRQLGFRSFA